MGLMSMMGDSIGCSATGERLVSAARDGDFQEAKALLQYNPRLAKYSTFGVRNSPLHYSAARGHHEVISKILLDYFQKIFFFCFRLSIFFEQFGTTNILHGSEF
jgi:hypothetical protein